MLSDCFLLAVWLMAAPALSPQHPGAGAADGGVAQLDDQRGGVL